MKELFGKIWEAGLPYQDQRDDDGHARTALRYAKKLLELEGGEEDIIIPAIILHDVGYSQIPRERRMLIFDRSVSPEQQRDVMLEHEREGVRLAGEILTGLAYSPALVPEILEIISQHDSRKGFISRNEGLVRDADKLWRFSEENFSLKKNQDGDFRKKICESLETSLENPEFLYSESAREIARKELEERRKEVRKS